MTKDAPLMDYPAMIDEAMRGVVRKSLQHVAQQGLPGDHHFYISFLTNFPGTHISPQLRERFPEEMTIVVQHQFWDLRIEPDHFSLMLSFNNIPEKLVVPFAALTAFADPSIKFGLQFHTKMQPAVFTAAQSQPDFTESDADEPAETGESKAQVISFDAFRKK